MIDSIGRCQEEVHSLVSETLRWEVVDVDVEVLIEFVSTESEQ